MIKFINTSTSKLLKKQILIFAIISNIMTKNKDWFESWFDTSYYHILYKHRDYSEGQSFLKNLITFLKLEKNKDILDLACGKGRHSIYLNSLGFNVIGADLSKNSIDYAKQFETEALQFVEHDMRNPFKSKFDVILNLFTSFGFFEDDAEDIAILQNIKNGLNPNGIAVIDFMNSKKVVSELVAEEVLTIDYITFKMNRYVKNGFIIKEINFDADGKHHTYFEKVKSLDFDKINSYVNSVGFKIKHTFGDYQLEKFNVETSDRLILVLE